jgi:hypothetical protein
MPRFAFFDTDIREQFIEHAKSQGMQPELDEHADEYLAIVPDDLDPDVLEGLEEAYNEIMTTGMNLWEQEEESVVERSAAGVKVELSDGTVCNIKFDAEIMRKLLGCLTPLELENLVQAIALAVENPTDAPICAQP